MDVKVIVFGHGHISEHGHFWSETWPNNHVQIVAILNFMYRIRYEFVKQHGKELNLNLLKYATKD